MNSAMPRAPSPRRPLVLCAALAVTVPMLVAGLASPSPAGGSSHDPVLVGRAVLPCRDVRRSTRVGRGRRPRRHRHRQRRPLPPARAAGRRILGDRRRRRRGEILAMPDNGFGGKANSMDFLIRAYYLRPHFKTAAAGPARSRSGDFISFRDPDHVIGLPDRQRGHRRRLLTGGDIDPESLQRRPPRRPLGRRRVRPVDPALRPARHGSSTRRSRMPTASCRPTTRSSSRRPRPPSRTAAASRRWRSARTASTSTPPSRAPRVADADQTRRFVYEFSTGARSSPAACWQYRTEQPGTLGLRHEALDRHRLVVIERDGGSGLNALFRRVYRVDLTTDRRERLPARRPSSWTWPRSPIPTWCPCRHSTPVTSGWATRSGSRASRSRPSTSSRAPAPGRLRQQPAEHRPQPGAGRRQRVHPRRRAPAARSRPRARLSVDAVRLRKTNEAAGQMNLTCGSGWWPGAGSNRRPTDFQSVARTN